MRIRCVGWVEARNPTCPSPAQALLGFARAQPNLRICWVSRRLLGVLNHRLGDRDYLAQTCTIADIACYPWVKAVDALGIDLGSEFANVHTWVDRISTRPAVQRAYAIGEPLRSGQPLDDAARRHLFGQMPTP